MTTFFLCVACFVLGAALYPIYFLTCGWKRHSDDNEHPAHHDEGLGWYDEDER
jgi:hypothetical protein